MIFLGLKSSPVNLSGSICALATPFRNSDFALDLEAFGRLIEYQVSNGTKAIVVAGSTGEGAFLDSDEFVRLIESAVRIVKGRVPVIAGSGLQSTRKTIEQSCLAREAGANAALVVAPAYVRPTQEGLYRHFREVADNAGLPILLYNVPSRTACDVLPETVARLATHPGIVGIKEAVADPVRMRELLRLRLESFKIYSGDDASCARSILDGADGVVSVAANVAPAAMQQLCVMATKGEIESVKSANAQLVDLHEVLGIEPNPIPVKWLLHKLGICSQWPRLPLLPLSAEYHSRAEQMLLRLGLLQAASAAT